jgi:hypothetical protein
VARKKAEWQPIVKLMAARQMCVPISVSESTRVEVNGESGATALRFYGRAEASIVGARTLADPLMQIYPAAAAG